MSEVHSRTPPQRWAMWIADIIPICLLPSALWRIAMVVGIPRAEPGGKAVGSPGIAHRRDDGVLVVPLTVLGP